MYYLITKSITIPATLTQPMYDDYPDLANTYSDTHLSFENNDIVWLNERKMLESTDDCISLHGGTIRSKIPFPENAIIPIKAEIANKLMDLFYQIHTVRERLCDIQWMTEELNENLENFEKEHAKNLVVDLMDAYNIKQILFKKADIWMEKNRLSAEEYILNMSLDALCKIERLCLDSISHVNNTHDN